MAPDPNHKQGFFFQPRAQRKWWELHKMDRREYGYTAIVGLIAGFIFSQPTVSQVLALRVVLNLIGGVLALAGFVCGIVWIVKTIRKKRPTR